MLFLANHLDPIIRLFVVISDMSMMCILDMKNGSSLLDMIRTTEQSVDFLEWNTLRFRNQEPDEDGETDIARHKEEERFPIAKCQRNSNYRCCE
jgi:hypothetical protein